MSNFNDMWSATGFAEPELDSYSLAELLPGTRRGLQVMASFALLVQSGIAFYAWFWHDSGQVLYTNLLLAALSIHVLLSAEAVRDVRTMQVLGMALLVVNAAAITLLAHRAGELTIGMMAAIVMLFVAIPLVPWALREALIVIGLTYALMAASLLGVPGRFDGESLLVLQLLILGSGSVVAVMSARANLTRKRELRARYDLEQTRQRMERLSMQDHLTSAWNRRYLQQNFDAIVERCRADGHTLKMAILDIDEFKDINDQLGHQAGDRLLVRLADVFIRHLGDDGLLVRLGGDEFQILYCGVDLKGLIGRAVAEMQNRAAAEGVDRGHPITLSAGIANASMQHSVDYDQLYRLADTALYTAKQQGDDVMIQDAGLALSGRWPL